MSPRSYSFIELTLCRTCWRCYCWQLDCFSSLFKSEITRLNELESLRWKEPRHHLAQGKSYATDKPRVEIELRLWGVGLIVKFYRCSELLHRIFKEGEKLMRSGVGRMFNKGNVQTTNVLRYRNIEWLRDWVSQRK